MRKKEKKQVRTMVVRFLFLLDAVLLGIVAGELLTTFAGAAVATVVSYFTRAIELLGEAGADSLGEE